MSSRIRRAAQIPGQDESLLWESADQIKSGDGMLSVYDISGAETPAFTDDGIEVLQKIIGGQVVRAG